MLAPLRPAASARYASIKSKDGWAQAHGYPLRIYIPDRYGMKQPKWITSIEITSREAPGFWVERGWSETAQARTTSVIDTVAVRAAYEKDGRRSSPSAASRARGRVAFRACR